MSKYHYKDHVEKEENTPELYFQFCIANELAEANRLKRIELEHQIRHSQECKCIQLEGGICDCHLKDLEDKA